MKSRHSKQSMEKEIYAIQAEIYVQYLKIERLKLSERSTHSTGRLDRAADTMMKSAEHMRYIDANDFYTEN